MAIDWLKFSKDLSRDDWTSLQNREAVTPPADGRHYGKMFGLVHPQWGGYCFPCVVEIQSDAGCFDVHEFHDGEFPTEHRTTVRHYCDAVQVVRFGLDVLELQAENCKNKRGPLDPAWIDKAIERLQKLKGDSDGGT